MSRVGVDGRKQAPAGVATNSDSNSAIVSRTVTILIVLCSQSRICACYSMTISCITTRDV